MKYLNAAEVLPEELIREIQKHVSGNLIYVPNAVTPKKWGEKSGSREYYRKRNQAICNQYNQGKSMSELTKEFGLAYDTIRRIIYGSKEIP